MAEALAQEVPLQTIFEKLTKVADDLKEKKNNPQLQGILKTLRNCVEDLAHFVQNEQKEQNSQEPTMRKHEDEIDHLKQKSLKGKIIITSKVQHGVCHIKTDNQLKEEKKSLVTHVKELVKEKYNQDITEESIQTCFRLKKGGILVKFWKKGKGSEFQALSSKIKSAEGSHINLFFNFMLTGRRGELLFEIRKLKREGKIAKFFSDEEGSISIQINKGERKIKVTDTVQEGTNTLKTWTVDDLYGTCS